MNREELDNIIQELDDDIKDDVRNFFQPFLEFNDFMLKEHNKTYTDIDIEIEETKQKTLAQRLSNIDNQKSKIEFIINEISIIYKEYALKYKYDKADEYQKATKKYLEFILKKTISENGK
jgi:hypothetical protein